MSDNPDASAREVLLQAESSFERLGHENLGFLSDSHGFMPRLAPRRSLPAAFAAWDAVAAALPDLYRTRSLRAAIDAMPLLDAGPLDDGSLLRASTILSILAHAHHRADATPAPLPAAVAEPWEDVTRRLNRQAPVLSYIDLIVYNWQTVDQAAERPMTVENLLLLVPTVDNAEERIFYLTQVEILARATPVVGAVVRAQEAALHEDRDALAAELTLIADLLRQITLTSLPKIDPNPLAPTYVDPVIWAKTVAPFAVPIVPGRQGPSGTSSPIFHLLDSFFARPRYGSILGKEMIHLRTWYPKHWRDLLDAVARVSCAQVIARWRDRSLTALYREALDAYAGDEGFLGRHRLKVYGYLDLAFKVGRTVTIGGFSGIFRDRTWDEVHRELEVSRSERRNASEHVHLLRPEANEASDEAGTAHRIAFTTAGTGIRFRPGDRASILPRNRDELVDITLRALAARGDEPVGLDRTWRAALALRPGYDGSAIPLRTLLTFGRIRPVSRQVAKLLAAISGSERLDRIIQAREEDQWELWDLVLLLRESGFDPRVLWEADPADRESICRVVPPETPRLYSVASAKENDASTLDLIVGELRYRTAAADSESIERRGTASSFLASVGGKDGEVPLRVIPAARFRPPEDAARPIVMFAGGTGISPFLAFLRARAARAEPGEAWLFVAARTVAQIHERRELERLAAGDRVNVVFALSRDDMEGRVEHGRLEFRQGARARIGDLIAASAAHISRLLGDPDPNGAVAYVCGRAGFARSVSAALEELLPGRLPQLAADGRFVREIFTTYSTPQHDAPASFDASEICMHNDEATGLWTVLDGRVYDLTQFLDLHPGGTKLLRGYAGMDASAAYRAVGHDLDPAVGSLRSLYEIGVVRRLHFGGSGGIHIGDHGLAFMRTRDLYRLWVRLMYTLVEMENAHRNDRSVAHRATTRDEDPEQISPFKAELMIGVHHRFVLNYVHGLREPLHELWAATSGACSADEDVRWMARRLDGLLTVEMLHAERVSGNLLDALPGGSRAPESVPADVSNSIKSVDDRDARLLAEVKDAVRAGVRLFELNEREVTRVAGGDLLGALRDIPDAIARWSTESRAADRMHPEPHRDSFSPQQM